MNKKFILAYLIIITSSFLNIVLAQRSTMYISGRYLYSAASEKVILRGINEMYWALPDKTGSDIIGEIAKTGSNSVRIGWFANPNVNSGTVADLDNAVNNCIQKKMIPVVELHDATGDFSKVQFCLDYWKRADMVALINKHKKWFILNIANEAGGTVSDDEYKSKYKDAIQQLRGVGIEVPLLIDGADYGNNVEQIIRCAAEIANSDSQKNTFFSCHSYWNSNHESRLNNAISAIVNNNLPIIFGESPTPTSYNEGTPDNPNCKPSPYNYFLQKFNENEIGWLVWSWGKVQNSDCKIPGGRSLFDITTDGKYGNWLPNNRWATDVTINSPFSIQKTSIIPPSFYENVGGGSSKAEAENGANIGVANANSFAGYSGTGYTDGSSFDNNGDAVRVTLNVSSGTYALSIRYNGRYGEKYQDLYVNGNYNSTIQFPFTTNWDTKTIPNISLVSGNNVIEIRKNWGWMDIDYIEAVGTNINTSVKLEAETGSTLAGVSVANSITGYSGNGYVEGSSLNDNGDFIKVFPQVNSQSNYSLAIRYNGRFGEKYQDIYINNTFYGNVQFPANNGWATKTVGNIFLNTGGNTIELRKSWGWMDVDFFIVSNINTTKNEQVDNNIINEVPTAEKLIIRRTAGNKIFIDATVILDANEIAITRLYNTEGKLLQQWAIHKNQKEWSVNKTLGIGIYIIQIVSKKGNFSKKLIVE
jgi:mannan endo-1,4-beta-mannosidase